MDGNHRGWAEGDNGVKTYLAQEAATYIAEITYLRSMVIAAARPTATAN
jgi:hypothetical protein